MRVNATRKGDEIAPAAARPWLARWRRPLLLMLVIAVAMAARVNKLDQTRLWVDEAESSINALTILEHGYPTDSYLGLPIYENTLIRPWPDHREYEFRDVSYSDRGVAVYHGWLPLYAMAGSLAMSGIASDPVTETPTVRHSISDWRWRTVAPRLPALGFSLIFLVALYLAGRAIAGEPMAWAALLLGGFARMAVSFGAQARYYAPTLAFAALCGLAVWQCMRRGRWRDFALAGVAFSLLFHTHILSCFVLVIVFGLMIPFMLSHRHAIWKMALTGGMLNLTAWPWLIGTGFLGHAAGLPKAYELMDLPGDLWAFPAERIEVVVLFAAGLGWLATATALRRRLPARLVRPFVPHTRAYLFLGSWATLTFLCFSLFIPAASYFEQRLTLMLEVPCILFLALVMTNAVQVLGRRYALPATAALAMLFLLLSGRMAMPSHIDGPMPGSMLALVSHLDRQTFAPGTRLYGTPNRHLAITYYTGLPVQSVAPVRKTFLDRYEQPIVFIDVLDYAPLLPTHDVRERARRLGMPLYQTQARQQVLHLATQPMVAEVDERAGAVEVEPVLAPLLPFVEQLRPEMHRKWERQKRRDANRYSRILVFRGYTVTNHEQWWQTFFYRFVDPESRRGENLNITDRLRDARAVVLPYAGCAIYYANEPVTPPGDGIDGILAGEGE
ncbi:MAG: hypothetical protein WD534_00790 [Phycisphaeraceae bacterium]